MWYKMSFYDDREGFSDQLDMVDTFAEFYAKEQEKHPEDAKELTLFMCGGVYYAYSKYYFHSSFFSAQGAVSCQQPQSCEHIFVAGDEGFSFPTPKQ